MDRWRRSVEGGETEGSKDGGDGWMARGGWMEGDRGWMDGWRDKSMGGDD